MRLLFYFLLLGLVACSPKQPSQPPIFRFHLFQEPLHLDPARLRASNANYFFYNTLRGLYRIDEKNQLQKEGGQCHWINEKKLNCQLEHEKWSDGSPVVAEDYKRSFVRLIDPKIASPRAHLLSSLKNAHGILNRKIPPQKLGIEIINVREFTLHFDQVDTEFLFKLASTALYPLHKDRVFDPKLFRSSPTNGPYRVSQWVEGKYLRMEANPFYKKGHPKRPPLELYFIDEDKTAYRLYQKKQLSFLRRVPTNLFDQLQKRKDFFRVPMMRFDYVGFGPELQKNFSMRKALAHSVNYPVLKKLLKALGRPGCPSIPSSWMEKLSCYDFSVTLAKKALKESSSKQALSNLKIKVSQLGGPDIKKQAEFLQNQWKQHLGVQMEVAQVEQKVFLSELRKKPPAVFRKGVGLDRPTCLSAMETFAQDSRQNFIGLKNIEYQKILDQMKKTTDARLYKSLCQHGIDYLLKNYLIIPLGEMHFGMLMDPRFQGWTINGMNQLDLSQLHLAHP